MYLETLEILHLHLKKRKKFGTLVLVSDKLLYKSLL